jgi:hypothetical protein
VSLPCDKVFALRSLLERPDAIEIDYDSTAAPDYVIFRRAAVRAVEEAGNLSMLLDRHSHGHD